MTKQLVKNMKIGDEVETQVVVAEVQKTRYSSPHRSGEYFIKLILGDVSGTIKGIIWDVNMVESSIQKDDIIFIKGEVTEYHGPQVIIQKVKKLDPEHVNRKFFQPVSARDSQEMLNELKQVITSEIESPHLKKLLKLLFSDREFVKKFATSPAARTIHHNYVGGLLEHTLEVIYFCRQIIATYPREIDRDLLLTGAIIHDMGKIEEYDISSITFELTTRGKLIGHISIGKEILERHLARLEEFPDDLKLELEHILLTHHGQKEWGSPEVPKTIHAFALFHADLVSARMKQFIKLMHSSQSDDTHWTEWDRFLDRSIYVKKPLGWSNG